MKTKTQPNESPAAQLETAKAELEQAQQELGALDIHKGALNEAASRRRELSERVEIAKERLTLAQSRFDEYEYGRIETEIAELMEDSAQIENELQIAREKAEADLRQHLNPDWLDGRGRFSSERPALGGLLGFCNSVAEVESRRDAVQAAIRSLERRIGDRRQELARQAAAARTDARRKLIGGDAVAVDLVPWRVECLAGFVPDVLDGLDRKFIPAALPSPVEPIIHVLIPSGSQPRGWIDGTLIESVEQMDPCELCPALVSVWQRANPPKKSGASRR
ncbi:MAG: hypothetical protein RBT03_02950 [Kiritimatiellia bacterium]|jgi:hypothetical protein|nr:hypothetical protein [Kiritimatiellia bacterium]